MRIFLVLLLIAFGVEAQTRLSGQDGRYDYSRPATKQIDFAGFHRVALHAGGGSVNLASPGAIGGTTPAAITGTTITATTKFLAPTTADCSAPAYSITGDTDTGVTSTAANTVVVCASGAAQLTVTSTKTTTASGKYFDATAGGYYVADGVNGYWNGVNYRTIATGNIIWVNSANANSGTPDTNLSRVAAGTVGVGTGAQGSVAGVLALAGLTRGTQVTISGTAPTIASGGCTSPAVTWSNGTAAFLLTIGTSCTGVKTVVLTMPAATNLWVVKCENNTSDAQQQSNTIAARATSTTAVTLTNYARTTGLQADFTASDTVLCSAMGG